MSSNGAQIDRRVFDSLDPSKMIPHGDRLLVEKVDVDNLVYVDDLEGGYHAIEIASGEDDQEEKRGYYFGRVIAMGDGHRLETPDLAVVVNRRVERNDVVAYEDGVVRVPATVPMPFRIGEILMLERFAGRELRIRGKLYRQVNQIDVIAHCPEIERALTEVGDAAARRRIAEADGLRVAAENTYERPASARA
jgi:co-chaperonin GroES (HSP10)